MKLENESRLKCYQDIKSMTTVEIEKHKIILNQEADQKIKVIQKEYETLYQTIKSSKTIEFEKLNSKQ